MMVASQIERARIRDVALINANSIMSNRAPSRIKYIDISSVGSGEFTEHPKEMLFTEAPSRARRIVQAGDTILSTVRPNRRSFLYFASPPQNTIASTGFAVLTPTPSIDSRYLYYWVTRPDFTDYLSLHAKGAAYPAVSPEDIANAEIALPPLPTQRRIASILSAYDDLIENNQRRIRILEEMARSLYREWFVHFRYPGHESVPLADSPLGPIPQGWEVEKLGDLITYSRRAAKPGPHLAERHYVPIDCLPPKSLALLEARPIEEAQSSLQLFEKGDILFGAMRPYFHKVVVAPFSGVTRTTCFVFKPVKLEWHAYATMTTFDEATVAYANAHSQGATIPYAVWDGSLSEMPLVLPQTKVLQRFETVVAPMLLQIVQSFYTLGNLRRTRDLLLPRLLSGQVALDAGA